MDWAITMTSVMCGIMSLLIWCWLRRRKIMPGTKMPPMPPSSSIFGHHELHDSNFHREKALQWSKEYGPVFRLRTCLRDVVVVNNIDYIKKFSESNQMLHRPQLMNFGRDYYKGLATMNGIVWQKNKHTCMTILRALGLGKSTAESIILDGFKIVEEEIDRAQGEPVYLGLKIVECAANNVASFFIPRIQSDGRVRRQLMHILKKIFTAYQGIQLYQFWPHFCQAFFPFLPFTSIGKIESVMKELDYFIIKEINNHAEVNGQTNFIQEYMKKVSESTRSHSSIYQYRYLVGHIKIFMVGGVDGPAISMQSLLVIFAARSSNLQRRVQREIDAVIGRERLPSWEDRMRMPFTLACVWELERWKRTEPFGLPRGTERDIVVDNFFIPKGTVVLFNLWAVNRDPLLWKDPHVFDPSRYLQEDGSLIPEKPSYHVGFSFGKRSCPGETFAIMEIFLMVTSTLQRYNVFLGQQMAFNLDDPAINIDELKNMKLRFARRSRSATTSSDSLK